ncbi:hypothetical protein HBI25_006100 [Parastagonospora nodorum]|nr:hypothetical protein HBH96_042550 [Parastagonospora nodorum]KAH5170009.1 hypothetical protein HBI73_006770 [Parastagonospora nodorum]KAH5200882.1 hypothetical protein HBH76_014250 [Parastagonospora nodorum]KAH5575863.1 hypothetical protein HBI25_006100 [Parastagonospora nodorum]KAH5659381.1 hypothetical protein HBI51_007450 [Parastagonospora nodorum]
MLSTAVDTPPREPTAQTGAPDIPIPPASPAINTCMPAPMFGSTPPCESISSNQALTLEKSVSSPSVEPALTIPTAATRGPVIPPIIKLGRSKGAQVLDRLYTPNSDGLFFHSFSSATAAMTMGSWQSPHSDDTIPNTEEEDREVVRRLFDAFMDLSGALDTPDNAYRKRFTPGSTVFYKPWTVERCAWDVLNKVKTIHQWGFITPITDVDILKQIGQTENWTFEERISMICRVLKLSKSIAVSLMKQEKVWTVIGAPHKLHNSSVVNNKSNEDRNKWVKTGRAEEKSKKRKTLHEEADEEIVSAAELLMSFSKA